MFATVDIPSGRTYDALAVPSEAIQTVQGRPVVFVQRSGTEFEQRQVETRLESDGWVEILSGVSTGDAVIAAGSSLAKAEALRDAPGGRTRLADCPKTTIIPGRKSLQYTL